MDEHDKPPGRFLGQKQIHDMAIPGTVGKIDPRPARLRQSVAKSLRLLRPSGWKLGGTGNMGAVRIGIFVIGNRIMCHCWLLGLDAYLPWRRRSAILTTKVIFYHLIKNLTF
jgi:hypothetical protein